MFLSCLFFFQAEDGIRDDLVTGVQTCALPICYSKFSGVNVNAPIINIITNPKNTLTYVVLNNGRLISYNSALGVETLIAPAAGGNCSGAAFYNNYIFLLGTSTCTDVSPYCPFDGVPSFTY